MLVIIMLGVILAIICYMFYVFRAEFFRVSERQSNTLMHIARMNRGLLQSLSEMFSSDEAPPEIEQTTDDGPEPQTQEMDTATEVIEVVGTQAEIHPPESRLPSVIEEVTQEVPRIVEVVEEVPRT